jgi:cystathionine beta-lyase family protein involved in aluminum resistance
VNSPEAYQTTANRLSQLREEMQEMLNHYHWSYRYIEHQMNGKITYNAIRRFLIEDQEPRLSTILVYLDWLARTSHRRLLEDHVSR